MLFTKSEWQSLHTIFSYLFFILVIVHLFFVNWKTFLNYFKSRLKAGINRKVELFTAVFLSGIVFAGTLGNWTPFGTVMAFGEKVKGGWESKSSSPPVLHMELFTLEKLSEVFDSVQTDKLINTLKENNIKVTGAGSTLREIANENKTTPAGIYEILSTKYGKHTGPVEGEIPQGIGKFTVRGTAEKTGKDVEALVKILKTKGVDADGGTTLRSVADILGISPREVYEMLAEK
jgi:hypothetical protein